MIILQTEGPIVATAIHAGHNLRSEILELINLDEKARRREEDPYTDAWTFFGDVKIIVETSRFECDVNRPRKKAVYLKPEDAWGLDVWKKELPKDMLERSLQKYDLFYKNVHKTFSDLQKGEGKFAVFDLHSYNHIRPSPDSPPANSELNPEVIVGTSNMDRKRWAPIVDRLISELRNFDFLGRSLDVRENVKWSGGNFSRWIHNTFPENGCSFAIEFKKFFMNEWSGELFEKEHDAIGRALASAAKAIKEELEKLSHPI